MKIGIIGLGRVYKHYEENFIQSLLNNDHTIYLFDSNRGKISSLERITYTTSNPRDMNDDLISLHKDNEKLNPYLHLPVQSGSDSILKNMNRKYTAKEYLKIIE